MFVCYNHTLLLTVTKTLLTLVKASQTKQIEGQNLTVLSILQQSGGPYIIHHLYYTDIACTLPLLSFTMCGGCAWFVIGQLCAPDLARVSALSFPSTLKCPGHQVTAILGFWLWSNVSRMHFWNFRELVWAMPGEPLKISLDM